MRNSVERAINRVIDKKLDAHGVFKGEIKNLYKYSKYAASGNLLENGFHVAVPGQVLSCALTQRDIYNNEFYNLLDSKIRKTQCKFNLLKLFKPGEILNSVSGY